MRRLVSSVFARSSRSSSWPSLQQTINYMYVLLVVRLSRIALPYARTCCVTYTLKELMLAACTVLLRRFVIVCVCVHSNQMTIVYSVRVQHERRNYNRLCLQRGESGDSNSADQSRCKTRQTLLTSSTTRPPRRLSMSSSTDHCVLHTIKPRYTNDQFV